jgi:hypothetical protein
LPGSGRRINVPMVRATVRVLEGVTPVVPIAVPDRQEVRAFAACLHDRGLPWKGEAFGWLAEYNPQRPEPPLDSRMSFTPADFCIGESGIWFYSLMWERGQDEPPVEFVDERNLTAGEG